MDNIQKMNKQAHIVLPLLHTLPVLLTHDEQLLGTAQMFNMKTILTLKASVGHRRYRLLRSTIRSLRQRISFHIVRGTNPDLIFFPIRNKTTYVPFSWVQNNRIQAKGMLRFYN